MGSGGRPQNSTSDSDGKFRLDGFTADRPIMLNVSAQGYATQQKNVTPPAADIAVVLKTAGTVRGRVEDADTMKPITDFTVGRTGPRGGGPMQIMVGRGGGDQAFQSDDGSFELTEVPPGKWTVRGSAAGYRAAEASGIEIGEGETKEGVLLQLKKGGGLAGRVLDPRGSAVANASVTWHPSESEGGAMGAAMGRMMGGGAGGSTTSDADGRFQFDGLPASHVTVTASHSDYLESSRDIDPAKEQSVDLTLGTGASISGTVVGTDGRSGVPGALVQLNEEGSGGGGFGGGGESTRSDGAGNFIFDHLTAGRFKVTASSNTGKTTAKDVVVGDNQPLTGVLMQMATGTLLHGTVTGLPAGRLGGVRVMAFETNYSDNTVTDDSGNWAAPRRSAGVIRLRRRRRSFRAVRRPRPSKSRTAAQMSRPTSRSRRLAPRGARHARGPPGLGPLRQRLSGSAAGDGRTRFGTDRRKRKLRSRGPGRRQLPGVPERPGRLLSPGDPGLRRYERRASRSR
jgi:hypothetical protein